MRPTVLAALLAVPRRAHRRSSTPRRRCSVVVSSRSSSSGSSSSDPTNVEPVLVAAGECLVDHEILRRARRQRASIAERERRRSIAASKSSLIAARARTIAVARRARTSSVDRRSSSRSASPTGPPRSCAAPRRRSDREARDHSTRRARWRPRAAAPATIVRRRWMNAWRDLSTHAQRSIAWSLVSRMNRPPMTTVMRQIAIG